MASASGPNGGGIISGINVTPLVDVMMVLLVIFVVTAKIIVAPAVPLDLPRAAHGEEVQVVLSIALPVHGPMLVNGTPVADDGAFEARARAAMAGNPELRAVIQADGDVAHRRVVHLLDELTGLGITRVAFGALPVDPPAPPPSPGLPAPVTR
ncbi:MAG TPA: biopolymer transporter ExbD [Polyangia bacterium]|nr:biopolymer transporter ExbD [Polyangia bacterium]